MSLATYLIKIDKAKLTSDLSDFVIPIQINTHSGTSSFDIATPFFARLGDYAFYENFENWNTTTVSNINLDSRWTGDALNPTGIYRVEVNQNMSATPVPVDATSLNTLEFYPDTLEKYLICTYLSNDEASPQGSLDWWWRIPALSGTVHRMHLLSPDGFSVQVCNYNSSTGFKYWHGADGALNQQLLFIQCPQTHGLIGELTGDHHLPIRLEYG